MGLIIQFRIATDSGWTTIEAEASDGSDRECYALPKVNGEAADRFSYWEAKIGKPLPRGRGMIWQIVSDAKRPTLPQSCIAPLLKTAQ